MTSRFTICPRCGYSEPPPEIPNAAAMVDAYKAGATLKEVAAAHGITPSKVLRLLIRQGIPRRQKGIARREVIANHQPIIDAYASGLSLQQVGEAFGISRQRVGQVLKRNSVTGRHGGVNNRNRTAERNHAIAAEYEGGAEVRDLAAKYHVHSNHVRLILRGQNVKIRARVFPEPPTSGRDIEIVRAFLGGTATADLAAQYGISATSVGAILYRNGARRRRPTYEKTQRNAVIVKEFQAGKTKSEIARAYGLTASRVSHIIRHVLSTNGVGDTA